MVYADRRDFAPPIEPEVFKPFIDGGAANAVQERNDRTAIEYQEQRFRDVAEAGDIPRDAIPYDEDRLFGMTEYLLRNY